MHFVHSRSPGVEDGAVPLLFIHGCTFQLSIYLVVKVLFIYFAFNYYYGEYVLLPRKKEKGGVFELEITS